MFEHDLKNEKSYHFSRFDTEHLLASISNHPLQLEGETWATAEHYVWNQLLAKDRAKKEVLLMPDGDEVFRFANAWYRSRVKNWKQQRRIYMTRALYTKVQMYPEVKKTLMETGEQDIIETSLYDHYWGIGRDQRGENVMGKIWMDIRKKIADEEKAAD